MNHTIAKSMLLITALALLPLSALANDLGSGSPPKTITLQLTPPAEPVIDWILKGDAEAAIKRTEGRHGCSPLSEDPRKRAIELLNKFASPRTDENAKYQAFCWTEAEKTVRELKKHKETQALAIYLGAELSTNRDSLRILSKVNGCSGPESEFKRRLKQQLQIARPSNDMFRTGPVQSPPAVTEKESLRQMRKAIYAETLTQILERDIAIAKAHKLGFENIIEKICPAGSVCAQTKSPRNLKEYLNQRLEDLKQEKIPEKSGYQVFQNLQREFEKLNKDAAEFNAGLSCRTTGAPMTGTRQTCNAASQFKAQSTCPEATCANPEKKKAQETADSMVQSLNEDYYHTVNAVLATDDGSLLYHEPFKTQVKTIYDHTIIPGSDSNLLFEKRHNETPGWDAVSNKTTWNKLDSQIRIFGGPEAVREAAKNTLLDSEKHASHLNEIEAAIQQGRDPDYGIFSARNPELAGLALMTWLDPGPAARLLMNNPQLANSNEGGVICGLLSAGGGLEKDKGRLARIQVIAGLGTLTLGVAATMLPTGVTQVVGPALVTGGTLLAAAGTAASAKGTYDSFNETRRAGPAFSATKNTDLIDDRQKANLEMFSNAAMVAGDLAAPAFLKALNLYASTTERALNAKILARAAAAAQTGGSALDELHNPVLAGALLSRIRELWGPEAFDTINAAAKNHRAEFKAVLRKHPVPCFGIAESKVKTRWLEIFEITEAHADDFGCSLKELDDLAGELGRFAGFDRRGVKVGDIVSVRRGDELKEMSNARVESVDPVAGTAIVTVAKADGSLAQKQVALYELGNHITGIEPAGSIPVTDYRNAEPGQRLILKRDSSKKTVTYVGENEKYYYLKEEGNSKVGAYLKTEATLQNAPAISTMEFLLGTQHGEIQPGKAGGFSISNNKAGKVNGIGAHSRFSAETDMGIGYSKGVNQDGILVAKGPNGSDIYVDVDGVGGGVQNEVTSHHILQQIDKDLSDRKSLDESLNGLGDRLEEQFHAGARSGREAMLVSAEVTADHIILRHAGDTKGFVINQGVITHQTFDHTLPGHMQKELYEKLHREGKSAQEIQEAISELARKPGNPYSFKRIGAGIHTGHEVQKIAFPTGSRAVIGSDVLDNLTHAEIAEIVGSSRTPEEASRRLKHKISVKMTNAKNNRKAARANNLEYVPQPDDGRSDNYSVIVIFH